MAAPPSVSVVLATNRGGPYLDEALRSVVDQTCGALEVIVVDDGAPTGVLEGLTARWPSVRVERHQGRGVSAARNFGAGMARGDLLAFLDDDDRWHPERLRRHVEVMVADPAAVASYCRMQTIDDAGAVLVEGDQPRARDEHDIFRGDAGVMLPNLVIRRAVFDSIGGFDPAYRQAEDLDLVLRAAAVGPFAFVDEVLVDYRHHDGNTTARHRELAESIRTVVRAQRHLAEKAGQVAYVEDFDHRLRANDRFAAWSAARAIRSDLVGRRWRGAASELGWVARFAPRSPWYWVLHRVEQRADG